MPTRKVRHPLSQRLLSRLLMFAYSAPTASDPPRNTFFGWFRFLGMMASGLALFGGSIWWIADGSYKDSYHESHGHGIFGIQNPLFLGGIGLFGILYAWTLRPWEAQKQKNAAKEQSAPRRETLQ